MSREKIKLAIIDGAMQNLPASHSFLRVKTILRAGQKWCDGACLNVEECYPMGEWMLIRCKLCVFRCACEIVCLWAYGSVWRTLVADAARATGHSVYLPTGGKGGAPLITAKQTETCMSPSSEHKITVFFPVDRFIAIRQMHSANSCYRPGLDIKPCYTCPLDK